MIVCPKCGGDTRVIETRDTTPGYQRRRRACVSIACDHRVSTLELIVDDTRIADQDPMLVPRRTLERILVATTEPLVAALGLPFVTQTLENTHGQKTPRRQETTLVSRSAEVEGDGDDGGDGVGRR